VKRSNDEAIMAEGFMMKHASCMLPFETVKRLSPIPINADEE